MDALNPKEIDFDYFRQPGKDLKLFDATPEKLDLFSRKLLINFLWLPDELRNDAGIFTTMSYLFPYSLEEKFRPINVYYEIGDFGGLVGFVGIIPEYKCDLLAKLWEPRWWGPTLARDIRELIYRFMRGWKLKRIGLSSPDERVGKFFANLCNFKIEGSQAMGFRHDGQFYTNFLYRKIMRGRK